MVSEDSNKNILTSNPESSPLFSGSNSVSTMRRNILIASISFSILALIVGAYFLGARKYNNKSETSAISAVPTPVSVTPNTSARPLAVTFQPNNSPFPTNLFAHPNEPAYEKGKGFAPDAQRVLDITALQISLEKYYVAKGQYPQSLDNLFPDFAPVANGQAMTAPPQDPETHEPYAYTLASDGTDYQLTATLASGEKYSVKKNSQ